MTMSPGSSTLRTMAASEFVRRIKAKADQTDQHFVFWLGAGCSVSSGIPAASALVREHWLPQLHQLRTGGGDLDAWVKTAFPDYDPADAGASYGTIMNERFPLPDDRQRETERLCSNQDPGFGYAVLASLMSREDGMLSTALTTNFDDLIADAMYVFGDRRPLVIEHDALAGFARPGRVRRPLVVKVHGDHRLNPMHTTSETAALTEGVTSGIRGLLQDRGVIFVGYSGNDHGVRDALERLPDDALPFGVWWVSRTEPSGPIGDWLKHRQATWVRAGTFDELMLLFHQEFGFEHPTTDRFDRMVQSYRRTYETLTDSVDQLSDSEPDSARLKQAARRADDAATDSWRVELEARRYVKEQPDRADEIYRAGLEQSDDAQLLVAYADFLRGERNDIDGAESYYQRALEKDPELVRALGNYANLLTDFRQDHDGAELLYERAAASAPDAPIPLGNFAVFLSDHRGDHARAETLYKRLLATRPTDSVRLANYGRLMVERSRDAEAKELIQQALLHADAEDDELRVEVSFYVLAMQGDEARGETLSRLAALIASGARSPGWDLSRVLARARADGHPDIAWLERLAAVISDGADPAVLDGWEDWPADAATA
jgi:tetratricopeptide (TPR) repeat protein